MMCQLHVNARVGVIICIQVIALLIVYFLMIDTVWGLTDNALFCISDVMTQKLLTEHAYG